MSLDSILDQSRTRAINGTYWIDRLPGEDLYWKGIIGEKHGRRSSRAGLSMWAEATSKTWQEWETLIHERSTNYRDRLCKINHPTPDEEAEESPPEVPAEEHSPIDISYIYHSIYDNYPLF